MNTFVQYDNVYPLIAPIDAAATAETSGWVDLKTAHEIAFCAFFGNLTSTSADQAVVVTVEASTAAATGSEIAIAFDYRLSSAAGTNTWGTKTAATTAGLSVTTASDDNKFLWIQLDPAAVQTALADARYVRLVLTPTEGTASLLSAFAVIGPRYKQNSMVAVSA